MALYDSSQLLNIVNSANAYYSSLYPTGVGISSSNPFGAFNDFSKINLKAIPLFNTSSNLQFNIPPSSTRTSSSSSSSLHSEMLEDLYSSGNSSTKWSRYGYDASAGARLAGVARDNSVGFTGYCARYVKTAISDAGLGNYEYGHAYQMDDILRRNKNFREIPASTDVRSLPAGCVLVFNQGSRGYSSSYGHTEITDGKGHGISDGVTHNLRQPDAIFMPVAA
jgi:hypothetical protein